jgi:hypothetical protein
MSPAGPSRRNDERAVRGRFLPPQGAVRRYSRPHRGSPLNCDWAAGDAPFAVTPDDHHQPPDSIQLPLSWVGHDDVPIVYANQFLIQYQLEGSFVLGIGQATPPALIGDRAQIEAQVRDIEFIPVRPLSRIALTEDKVKELIAALQASVTNAERVRRMIDPRGGESA